MCFERGGQKHNHLYLESAQCCGIYVLAIYNSIVGEIVLVVRSTINSKYGVSRILFLIVPRYRSNLKITCVRLERSIIYFVGMSIK